MRSFFTLAAVLASLVGAAPCLADPRLELEVGAGASSLAHPTPTFAGRIGVDLLDWFTPSLQVMSATPLSGAAAGFGIIAELRAHTRGRFQLTGGVGMGLATASFTSPSSGLVDAQLNRVSPYLFADLGVRVTFGPFWVGASVGGAPLAQQWLALLTVGFAAFGS